MGITTYDGSDSFGVGGTIGFGPQGVTGAVTGVAGNTPTAACPTCGTGGGVGLTGFGMTGGVLILIAAVIIIAVR